MPIPAYELLSCTGSPWQNPYVESFGSSVHGELLAVELFSCLAEGQVLVEDWRQDSNTPPTEFATGYGASTTRSPLPFNQPLPTDFHTR